MSKIKCPQCQKSFNKQQNHQGWHHVCTHCHNTFSLLHAIPAAQQLQKAPKFRFCAGHAFLLTGLLVSLAFFILTCNIVTENADLRVNLGLSLFLGLFVGGIGYLIYKMYNSTKKVNPTVAVIMGAIVIIGFKACASGSINNQPVKRDKIIQQNR